MNLKLKEIFFMHTENSDRGWWLDQESNETSAQRERRESAQRFYAAKEASESRDCSYEDRLRHEDTMREEFLRELPKPPRDYLNEP